MQINYSFTAIASAIVRVIRAETRAAARKPARASFVWVALLIAIEEAIVVRAPEYSFASTMIELGAMEFAESAYKVLASSFGSFGSFRGFQIIVVGANIVASAGELDCK